MENKGFENDPPQDGGSVKGSEKEKSSMHSTVSLEIPQPLPDKPYAGMGKEDLLRFSNTPFWNRLRTGCLVAFWLGWAGLLVAVLVLTVLAPRCAPPPEQTWYQKTVMYQVFVRSFYDSDGDGIGDLNGITSKLEYIEDMNAEAIVLSSFYKSHYDESDRVSDFGYDVTDHRDIDASYGTMDDFENLIEKAHARDIKVIIDFIPNHTGDKHDWFVQSSSAVPGQYENYYVWRDCLDFPDWVDVYNKGSAFTATSGARGDCYLHQFLDTQPDLNLRSAQVRQELESILRFWLDKDVDGFRVMNARYLFEDSEFRNEAGCAGVDRCRTAQQQENYEIIPSWRAVLEEYSANRERILLVESQGDRDVNDTMRYYGTVAGSGAQLPLNFQLTQIQADSSADDVKTLVDDILRGKPAFGTADWLTGFQDTNRKVSSGDLGEDFAGALAVLKMTLPGTAIIYYGEELGMVDAVAGFETFNTTGPENTTDPTGLARERYRTPMQWDSTGGFVNGSGDSWIPVNPDTNTKNVKDLEEDDNSILNVYRNLASLHREDSAFHYGDIELADCEDADIFAFVRYYDGTDRYLVAVNMATTITNADLTKCQTELGIPGSGELVVLTKANALERGRRIGDNINLKDVSFAAREAAVFSWPYSR